MGTVVVLQTGKNGGARRDRTADLLHAMQALSRLSYGPESLPLVATGGGLYLTRRALSSRGRRAFLNKRNPLCHAFQRPAPARETQGVIYRGRDTRARDQHAQGLREPGHFQREPGGHGLNRGPDIFISPARQMFKLRL